MYKATSVRQRSRSRDRHPKSLLPANVTVFQDAGFVESVPNQIPIDDKLADLHREMQTLRLECDRLINKHLLVERTLSTSCTLCPPETSSAYNTGGESCRSDSITPDGTFQNQGVCADCCIPTSPRTVSKTNTSQQLVGMRGLRHTKATLANDLPPLSPPQQSRKVPIYAVLPHRQEPSNYGNLSVTPSQSLRPSLPSPRFLPKRDSWEYQAKKFRIPTCSIVLRDEDHQQTPQQNSECQWRDGVASPRSTRHSDVRLQETLYMFDRPVEDLEELSDNSEDEECTLNGQTPGTSRTLLQLPVDYKWKVKRRCDGSRYVVKRPIRNQLLKKREAQLNKERTGISTDDDAMSELKFGQFCNRDDRKKHLERERARKMRQHQKIIEAKQAQQGEKLIADLAQRKMAKKKKQTLLDGFTSTQEYLSQRHSEGQTAGILSVTTV